MHRWYYVPAEDGAGSARKVMANARDWPNGRRTTMNYAAVNDILHDVQSIIIILYNGDVTTTTGLPRKEILCVCYYWLTAHNVSRPPSGNI